MLLRDPEALEAPLVDLDKAKADYERDGYCIIPQLLSEAEVAALRQRIVEQAEAEKALGWAFEDSGPGFRNRMIRDNESVIHEAVEERGGVNQRIYFLINKGKILRDLATHPVLLELVTHSLGQKFLLSSFTANIAKQGADPDRLHRDTWMCPIPASSGEAYDKVGDIVRLHESPRPAPKGVHMAPGMCNAVWMMTDFTEENGATRIVPKSHLLLDRPDASYPYKVPTIAATGKAGSCMFFDGRLWHATGQNLTNDPRVGVLTTFCGPQFRPAENYFVGLDPAILNDASEKLLDILGFTSWRGYGVADMLSSRRRLSVREPWIGEMRLDRAK